jgi:heat shock protein HslJ
VLDESVETADEAVTSDPSTGEEAAVPAEIVEALGNASYPLDYTGTGIIQLTGGEFREPAAPDSAAENVTQLTEHIAMGELSSGQSVIAAILVSQTGGTGTFYDLAVLQVQDGVPSNPVTTYLGDRIVVNNLAIENGQIMVDMIVQGPEDPLCCPTQQVISTYELDNGELLQTSSELMDTVDPSAESLSPITNIVWKWQELTTPLENVTIDNPEKYTVEFYEDGSLSITADCNFGGGTYKLDSDRLTIDIRSSTLTSCPEGSYSNLFFSGLNNAGIYFMDGDDLMIDQIADSGTMRFTK